MKKIICFILTITLMISTATAAFAKQENAGGKNKQQNKQKTEVQVPNKQKLEVQETEQQEVKKQKIEQQVTKKQNVKEQKAKAASIKEKKQSFKINGSPVIKYGKFKLPISPITKGMGAKVAFDKQTAVLTVTKDTTTIAINFKDKTVTVNGVTDTTSGIFTASNSKKMTVLIKYIANKLGVRVSVEDDKVTVVVPGLDLPTGVTVIPVATTLVTNTLNTSTLYLNATANITVNQATGGKAELYVNNKLIATDAEIAATDTTVSFSTSDGTPTNEELQALIPTGGVVTVKLYNAKNESVTSAVANPIIVTDYVAPTISSVSSAALSVSGSALTVAVTGAGAVNDKVDASKLTLMNTTSGLSYQLTAGSNGLVSNDTTINISLCAADILGITNMGNGSIYLNAILDSMISDQAGNHSTGSTTAVTVPVTITN